MEASSALNLIVPPLLGIPRKEGFLYIDEIKLLRSVETSEIIIDIKFRKYSENTTLYSLLGNLNFEKLTLTEEANFMWVRFFHLQAINKELDLIARGKYTKLPTELKHKIMSYVPNYEVQSHTGNVAFTFYMAQVLSGTQWAFDELMSKISSAEYDIKDKYHNKALRELLEASKETISKPVVHEY